MKPNRRLLRIQYAVVPLALLVVCAPATMAQLEPFEADMVVRGDVVFHGLSESRFDLTGAIIDYRDGDKQAATGFQFQGSFAIYEFIYTTLETTPGSPVGTRGFSHSTGPELIHSGFLTGEAQLTMDGPRYTARLVPEGPCTVRAEGDFKIHPFASVYGKYARQADPVSGSPQSDFYPEPGAHTHLQRPSDLACTATLVVADGLLSLGDDSHALYRSSETEAESPPGTEKAESYRQRYAVLIGSFHADSPDAWTFYAKTASMTGTGDLSLHSASGAGSINGTAISSAPRQLQVRGAMNATAAYEADGGHWRLRGETVFVGVNAGTVFGDREAPVHPAAVAAAGLLVALVASMFSALGREVATLLVGRNIAEPLGCARRVEILAVIRDEPGLTRTALVGRTGLSRTAVIHHLRVLRRSGLIESVGGGKIPAYIVRRNSYNSQFRGHSFDGQGLQDARALFSELDHPLRREIVEQISGGCRTFRSMMAVMAARGRVASAAQLRYHCRKLRDAGIIEQRMVGRHSVHDLKVDYAGAIREYRGSAVVIAADSS